MKASNERDPIQPDPMQPDPMHQNLCAYVLGEASDEERAAVETALAASAELRDERARLEGTIGLVQTAFTGSEVLSGGAMLELMDAAGDADRAPSAPVAHAWYHSPVLRAAAAVVGLLGGVALIVTSADDTSFHDSTIVGKARPREAQDKDRAIPPALRDSTYGLELGDAVEEGLTQSVAQAVEPVNGSGSEKLKELTEGRPEDRFGVLRQVERRAGEVTSVERSQTGASSAPSVAPAEPVSELVMERETLGRTLVEQPDTTVDMPGLAKKSIDEFFLGADFAGVVTEPGQLAPADSWSTLDLQVDALTTTLGAGGGGPEIGGRFYRQVITPPVQVAPSGPSTPGPVGPGSKALRVVGGQSSGSATPAPQGAQDDALLLYGKTADIGVVALDARDKSNRDLSRYETDEVGAQEEQRGRTENLYAFSLGFEAADEEDMPGTEALVKLRGLAPEPEGRFQRARRELSADELRLYGDQVYEGVIRSCRPRPNERPRDMFFRFWGDNPFEITRNDALSTFSVDVDTASYALARRYLNEGHIPTKAQIRTEEFVNYFDADLPAPTEETFAIHTELAPSLFGGSQRMLLRVGVRGKEVAVSERKPLALTFVVDTSGSMRENDRLELVKHAMRLLVGQLDARDSIAIVAFSKETRLVLPMTSAANHGVIESAIHPLSPDGSTNAEAGLRMGYEVALAALDSNAHNRVVFLSDGVANVGQTDQDRIAADVRAHSDRGLFLNTIGVGMNNHNDVFLEQLADNGDGICDYVDSAETAQRAIVERFTAAMVPIASDVKIQVEFDPAQVTRYRLLGYENRAIADKDFRNDKIDAGEVGAGHQVQALYELELSSVTDVEKPLAKVMLRWKAPKVAGQDVNEVDVTEISSDVAASSALASFATASPGYRRTVLVAQFAEFLRRSVHARGDSYETLMMESAALAPTLADSDFDEFVTLTKRAFALNLPAPYFTSDLDRTIDEYRRFQYLNHQLGELERGRGDKELEELRKTNEEMERKIRDLIRTDLERENG